MPGSPSNARTIAATSSSLLKRGAGQALLQRDDLVGDAACEWLVFGPELAHGAARSAGRRYCWSGCKVLDHQLEQHLAWLSVSLTGISRVASAWPATGAWTEGRRRDDDLHILPFLLLEPDGDHADLFEIGIVVGQQLVLQQGPAACARPLGMFFSTACRSLSATATSTSFGAGTRRASFFMRVSRLTGYTGCPRRSRLRAKTAHLTHADDHDRFLRHLFCARIA